MFLGRERPRMGNGGTMQYISTRNKNNRVSASFAIVNGLAEDGGLYIPESIPQIPQSELEELREKDYCYRAAYVMAKFLEEFTFDQLYECAQKAYARFEGDPAPLVKVDENLYVLELWHGPTLAFKDIALTILPHLLNLSKEKLGICEETKILVATSGDTGKAALEGFRDVPGTSVTVFYPSDGVSQMQKLQMMTQEGSNLSVYGVKGNFDDCQTAVKAIFADRELAAALKAKGVTLSSANSINWGRLLPQIVYYISSYIDLVDEGQIAYGDRINFCVPTGNFGDILAGWYACQMGIPVNRLICASNENNVLADFLHKGEYSVKREFYKTMSPSMDILISSNLERLLFENSGRDDALTASRMQQLKDSGCYRITAEELERLNVLFCGGYAVEDEVIETICDFFSEYNYPLDPHTAVAACVNAKYAKKSGDKAVTVLLSTANPYKFPQDVLYALTGDDVRDSFRACKRLLAETAMEIPDSISALKTKPKLHQKVLPAADLKSVIQQ